MLAFLEALTGASSALNAHERTRIIRELDELAPAACTGALVRWLALACQTELVSKGSLTSERHLDAPCPRTVIDLLADVARAFAPNVARAFDPCMRDGSVLAAIRERFPQAALAGQVERFSDALASALAARCEGWSFEQDSVRTGPSLTDDRFSDVMFDLVASVLPPNQGEWCVSAPDPADLRWAFGVPPRNKANLAWLQHAHAHRAPGGYAVLLAANALLHEGRGCEPAVRAELVASGCVRAVIALPGGLFDDDRPPLSIVVLGDARAGECETLFVDALASGSPSVPLGWPPRRTFDPAVARCIASLVEQWARTGAWRPFGRLRAERAQGRRCGAGRLDAVVVRLISNGISDTSSYSISSPRVFAAFAPAFRARHYRTMECADAERQKKCRFGTPARCRF